MPKLGRVRDAIQWYEGMLLMPQHFQQSDHRLHQLLSFHINTAVSHHWGITHFTFDPAILVAGKLRVLELEAITPDGLVVSTYANEGDLLEVDLNPFIETLKVKPLKVFLIIPEYKPGTLNVSNQDARFMSRDGSNVVDENTGEGKITFPTLQPNLGLFIGEEVPSRYIALPLMEVYYSTNGFATTDYIAPLLKVETDSPLGLLGLDLAKAIREKIAFLGDQLYSNTGEIMSAEAEQSIRALTTGLLSFEATLHAGAAHPFQLYLQLATVASHVATLHLGQMPPVFKAYQHNDIRASYLELISYINSMLARIQEGYFVVPFSQKDRLFSLSLKREWIGNYLILGVKASPAMNEKDLVAWLMNALIASETHVSSSRDKRILGATRKIIESDDEMKLFPAKDVLLFSVEVNPRFINPDENLQIFNIADTQEKRPIELVLYVPKKI